MNRSLTDADVERIRASTGNPCWGAWQRNGTEEIYFSWPDGYDGTVCILFPHSSTFNLRPVGRFKPIALKPEFVRERFTPVAIAADQGNSGAWSDER